MLLQVHEGDRPAQTRRHPRRTAGVGATRTGAGARGSRTGSLGNAAGEAGVELDPESEQVKGLQNHPRIWVKGLQNRPSRGNSVLGTAPPGSS